MKTPKLITTLFANLKNRTETRLRAATAAERSRMDSYDSAEPTTRLSSAFVIVLILHLVAIGGIYAFNSIRASRLSREPKPAAKEEVAKVPAKPIAKAPVGIAAVIAAEPRLPGTPVAPSAPTVSPRTGLKQYVVKAGDNPTKIAFAYTVKTEELLAANNLKTDAVLHPGDTLTIPKSAAKPPSAEPRKPDTAPAKRATVAPTKTTPGVHIVKKKETATSIAKIYGLAAADLLKLNKISDPTKIREGQPLTIPKKKE